MHFPRSEQNFDGIEPGDACFAGPPAANPEALDDPLPAAELRALVVGAIRACGQSAAGSGSGAVAGELQRRGRELHDALDLLDAHRGTTDAAEYVRIVSDAVAELPAALAAVGDEDGYLGDAGMRLLELHAAAAEDAGVDADELLGWMLDFQFGPAGEYFVIDVVEYAPLLGEAGVARYREEIARWKGELPPIGEVDAGSPEALAWLIIEHNEQRLAVLDRDGDAIIRTYESAVASNPGGLRSVALRDIALSFEEIDEIDLALEWIERAVAQAEEEARTGGPDVVDPSEARDVWMDLLEAHRPDDPRLGDAAERHH